MNSLINKIRTMFTASLGILLVGGIASSEASAKKEKASVCHLNDFGDWQLNQVGSARAKAAHLAHGDWLPGDEVDGFKFDDNCARLLVPACPCGSIQQVDPFGYPIPYGSCFVEESAITAHRSGTTGSDTTNVSFDSQNHSGYCSSNFGSWTNSPYSQKTLNSVEEARACADEMILGIPECYNDVNVINPF